MSFPVLKKMSTEDALYLLRDHGVIKDLNTTRLGWIDDQHGVPGWSFVETVTDEKFVGTTPQARRRALSLQQNLNIVLERTSPVTTPSDSRVFWPGDELPRGIVVMGRDGSTGKVEFSGMKVSNYGNGDPLVEVVLPDYARIVAEARVRRLAREAQTA